MSIIKRLVDDFYKVNKVKLTITNVFKDIDYGGNYWKPKVKIITPIYLRDKLAFST